MTLKEIISSNDPKLFNVGDYVHGRTNLAFLYIGVDAGQFAHLNNRFELGYKEETLHGAGELMLQLYLYNNRLPDVLFIDVPLHEEELIQFCSRLKTNVLFSSLPIIYSDKLLTKYQIKRIHRLRLIDDIITINSIRIDYYSKVIFIKQSKLHNQLLEVAEKQSKKSKWAFNSFSILKRMIDISFALTCISILSPILILLAIAIKLESKGPIFYTSLRAGRGFKVFKFYKFRSMVVNADKDVDKLSTFNQYSVSGNGPKFFKINNDPRVTKLGKFLRNTSADELPQLLNVIKGDMSLVGNRPLPIYEAVSLTTNDFVERFAAPAGITGLWQVNKRGKAEMSIEERIHLDIIYSRKCSFFYDLKILAKTPVAIFQKNDV